MRYTAVQVWLVEAAMVILISVVERVPGVREVADTDLVRVGAAVNIKCRTLAVSCSGSLH